MPIPLRVGLLSLLLVVAIASRGRAQDVFYVCDSTADAVFTFSDSNSDGSIDPLLELTIYYDDSSDGPDLSTPNHLLPYNGGLLLSDGGTLDGIFFLSDLNGDGDANDVGEIFPFYDDSSPGIDLSSPNALALAADGSIFVTDDGAAVRAILRLTDSNSDGDANDDGEVTVFYDGTAATTAPAIEDPESIAITDGGVVFVGDSSSGVVYRLQDLNGDGDALDADEVQVYYSAAAGIAVTDIDTLQVSGDDLYIVDEDSGTVLRVHDDNDDGDALDAGESELYLDGSFSSDPNDAVLYSGGLLLADGALDGIAFASDTNGNGVATDPGEISLLLDGSGAISTPTGIVVVLDAAPSPTPELFSLSPAAGSEGGGETVTITGLHLTNTLSVTFGSEVAIVLTTSDSEVAVETPAGSGVVSVTVTTTAGTATLVNAYQYLAAANLVITGVSPTRGSTFGGTQVTVDGAGWDASQPIAVMFGGSVATVDQVTTTQIVVTTAATAPGSVDITVSQGALSDTLDSSFLFQTPFMRGDANRDNQLELTDPIEILYYVFSVPGPAPTCLDAMDVNDDFEVSAQDALLLLNYLFLGGVAPAAPFPSVELDPTPGAPGCEL